MKGKKVRQCYKNRVEMYMIQFRYASAELFFDEPLKIIFLKDEGNERGDSVNQH